jgi:two-component system, LuxR family, response regulator FixJ
MRIVCIVDDDEAIRDSLRLLIESYGMAVREYASATAYLNDMPPSGSACLLLDLHMPGMSGLELLELLRRRRIDTPVILITGRNEPILSDRIERAGVLALLHKPVGDDDLMAYIERAFAQGKTADKSGSAPSAH